MGRQGNRYEQTVAFIVIVFVEEEGSLVEKERLYLQEEFELPISKKRYKSTLKNVEVFIEEYMQVNYEIKTIRLDRISHVNIYER